PEDIENAAVAITTAHIVVCQWEIPTETIMTALRMAHEAGVKTIFNPAPVQGEIPAEMYRNIDILCANETEAEQLTGMAATTIEQTTAAARRLLERGPHTIILTLGERGSLLVTAEGSQHIPAPQVNAVDTTGAGDA